jgi:hypothetical protein
MTAANYVRKCEQKERGSPHLSREKKLEIEERISTRVSRAGKNAREPSLARDDIGYIKSETTA